MKKLAIVYPAHYQESSGGAELQISYLCQAAAQSGWEVHYVYVPSGKNSIETSEFEILHPLIPHQKRAHFFRYQKQIKEKLEEIQPDLIYTRHTSSWLYYAASFARKNKIPHVHAMPSDASTKWNFGWNNCYVPHRLADTLLFHRGMRLVRNFITQNNFQYRQIQKRFHRTATPIAQMTPGCPAEEIKKDPSLVTILWIANLKELKRPHLFLELAEKINASGAGASCQFKICGRASGEYLTMMQNAMQKIPNFQYLGELSQAEVNQELAHGDLLINTSIYEGFSNTFVQAWMRKVPVISMNSDPNQSLSQEKLGSLAPTAEELLQKTLYFIQNPELRQQTGDKARVYAEKHHSLEQNMPILLDTLEKICNL